MTKVATIASLIRAASRTEADFQTTSQNVMDAKEHDRTAEFFDRLNIPRSVAGDAFSEPLPEFVITTEHIGDFTQERAISNGIQKFLDRHERKIKWHATHPSIEGADNVLLLMRCSMATTQMRLTRLSLLLRQKEELTPVEWAVTRELMNRSYLSFRNYMNLFSGMWVDSVLVAVSREDLLEKAGTFHEILDGHILSLEEHRNRLEERRLELTVLPEGFPPVRPPIYFGGDLMGRGPWRQYWSTIETRAHHVRESLGLGKLARLERSMLLASLALLACQPAPAERPATGCDATRPREGEVVVERVACEERLFASTEGRGSDLWVANAWTRAVVRHPAEALTVPGVGGGTVIDASGWSSRDALHEVVPLVDGGWLDVAEWSLAPDHLEVRGEVRSLPDTPAASPGAQRVVRWVPDPWSPWLCAEGADGLWIHAAGEHELLDGRLVGERLVYAHDGTGALDLGGALRADGVCLLASPTSEAWGWLAPSGRGLAGIAPEADEVTLLRAGERVGRVRVDQEGAFSTRVPDDVDAVRAEADGRAPGPEVAVGEALELEVGDPGTVQLVLAWEGGPPRPVRVDWSDARGRGGTAVLPGGGGDLALGAGAYDLALGAGPAVEPLAVRVEVPGGSEVQLGAALRWIFDPGEYVLVDLAVPGDRSRTWRGTDARALREAASSGVAFAVLAPEDDAAAGEIDEAWSGAIRWRDGALHTSHQGWRIVSWPWAATARHGGHGVPAMGDLGPTDGLSVAWGGEGKGRITAVDPAWLDAVEEPPWRVWPRPDLVRLDSPWELDGWLHWLDAGVALAPTGPLTWVEVADPGRLATADAEDALTRGRTCATTGPLVRLEVDGLRPGDTRDDLGVGRELPVVVEVLAAPGDLDALVLLGAGGRVLQRWEDPPGRPLEARIWSTEPWIAAAAWSEDGSSWAVTGPVWLSPPG